MTGAWVISVNADISGRKGQRMYETTVREHIGRPIEEVYAYLADLARHAEWAAGLVAIERTTPGPAAVGSEYRSVESVPGRFVSFARITALEPPTRIVWEARDERGVMRAQWIFELRQSGEGTDLAQRARFEPQGPIGAAMLLLLRRWRIPGENRRSLARIRAVLERASARRGQM